MAWEWSQSEKWSDWGYEEGDWAQGTNNKARPSGSGTTSWARRQRVQAAARERDRLAAAGHADALEAQAKAAARKAASMKKQAEEAQEEAARIAEALEASRKKRKMTIPCQKEKGSKRKGGKEGLAKPCQKVSSKGSPAEPCQKVSSKGSPAEPCQKVSSKGSPAEPCQKVSSKESPAEPCQKVSKKESLAEPCQKVPAKDPPAGTSQASNPCQKDSEKQFGPSEKEMVKRSQDGRPLPKSKPKQTNESLEKGKKQEEETLSKGTAEWKKKERQLPSPSPAKSQADWGRSSGSTSSSESSSNKEPLSKGPTVLTMKPNKNIAVDWHGVLVVNDQYNKENTECLESLKKAGYEVHLLSYCGYKRSQEVWNWAWHEWEGWSSVNFTWKKCGPKGKAVWCQNYDISKMIDDNMDICWECLDHGIESFPISLPGSKFDRNGRKSISCYSNFKAAVQEILSRDE